MADEKLIQKVVEYLLRPSSFEAAAKVCLCDYNISTSSKKAEKILYQNTLWYEIEKIEAAISRVGSGFKKANILAEEAKE